MEQRLATGFGRAGVINSEGGIIDEEYRDEYVTDRVNTLSAAWLGLTVGCAHCHDHKFDPITQRDHYRLFAFFNNVPEIGEDGRTGNAVPIMLAPTAEQQAKMRELESAISTLTHKVEDREKNWSWREESSEKARGLAAHSVTPGAAVLQISCESAKDSLGFALAEGVVGKACVAADRSEAATTGQGRPESKRQAMTFSAWLRPEAADTDVALLSTMNYATNVASTGFGKGLEFRLVGGEVEFRYADRFPAYSIRVRSEGAHIAAGEWRHVTVIYDGAVETALRAEASRVRIFADGRELPVQVLNDGLSLPDKDSDKAFARFRIGWDTSAKSQHYAGRFDEMSIWQRALAPAEIAGLFESQAIPYALARQQQRRASAIETGWLRTVLLKSKDAAYAEDQKKLDGLRAEWLSVRRSLPSVMVMEEMATPRETHILLRGAYDAPGDKVDAGVPEELLGAWPMIGKCLPRRIG